MGNSAIGIGGGAIGDFVEKAPDDANFRFVNGQKFQLIDISTGQMREIWIKDGEIKMGDLES